MNHDYEHCIDFKDDCPESCHRAQLVRDLEENYPEMEVSWMNFGDCPDCERNRLAKNSPKAAKNIDDQISRSAIVSALKERAETLKGTYGDLGGACSGAAKLAESMPPVQPEIIYCKNCRKHNKKVGFDENFHTVWKEDACPLVSWRGKAQGHEFDYQFCAYADKREEVRNERKAEQSQ